MILSLFRVLNARHCPITDAGIQGLCNSSNSFHQLGKTNCGLGLCKSIEFLDIFGTTVTKKGIKIILENLPALVHFDCDFQMHVLAELLEEYLQRKQPLNATKFTCLRNIGSSSRSLHAPYKSSAIGLLATACSSVNEMYIKTDEIKENSPSKKDEALLQILNLQQDKLCKLGISGRGETYGLPNPHPDITFNGGIFPLLKHFGSSLTSLTLGNLLEDKFSANIRTIVECCPKLESLTLAEVNCSRARLEDESSRPSKRVKMDPLLKHLKYLEIDCFSLDSDDFDLLLASPGLVTLKIENNYSIKDEILGKAAQLHQFKNLEYLKLYRCIFVTNKGVALFMNESNSLKKIEFEKMHLSKNDFSEWKRMARERDWDVVFDFKLERY